MVTASSIFHGLTMLSLLLVSVGLLFWSSPASMTFLSHSWSSSGITVSQTFPSQSPLKVLCVGDSITVGIGDGNIQDQNNGYRLDLYNSLTAANITAEFIGTQISGTDDNPQPRMEGYGWQTIDTILSRMQGNNILSEQPNLILIHAGTNDNDLPQTSDDPAILFADAPARLGHLLDYVLSEDPDTIVLVAELIQNKYNQTQTDAFNAQVPNVVSERYDQGFMIQMVNMTMVGGNELLDALHPTAMGYYHVANLWYNAIMAIPDDWWTITSKASRASPASSPSVTLSGTPVPTNAPNQIVPTLPLPAGPLATATPTHVSSSSRAEEVSSLWLYSLIAILWIMFHG